VKVLTIIISANQRTLPYTTYDIRSLSTVTCFSTEIPSSGYHYNKVI